MTVLLGDEMSSGFKGKEIRISIPRSRSIDREIGCMEASSGRVDHLKRGASVLSYESALAGAISGGVARMVTAPLDTIKIRLQLQEQTFKNRQGVSVVLKNLLRTEGPVALWKGNVPAEIMYILYGAVQFTSYQFLNQSFDEISKTYNIQIASSIHSLITGIGAGGASTLVTYPFDLLRTRLAANSNKQFLSMTSTIAKIVKTEGLQGCFSGIKPAMLSVAMTTGIMFSTYDRIMEYSQQYPGIPFIEAICGFIAGATSKGITFPLDTLRKRCQMFGVKNSTKNVSAIKLMKRIIVNEGIFGFYKGFGISVLKTAPTSAVSMWMYEYSLNMIRNKFD